MEIARTFSIDLVFVGKTTKKQQATGNKDYLSLLTIFNTNAKAIILFNVLFIPNTICTWQILKGLLFYSSCTVHSLFHSELLISLVWKPNKIGWMQHLNVSNLLDSLSRCLKLVGCTRRSEIQCLRRCVDTESLCKHDQLARIKGSKANTRQTLSHKWMEKRPAGCVGWNVSMRFHRPVKDHPVVRLLGADRHAVAVEGAAGEPGEGATSSNSNHVHVVP